MIVVVKMDGDGVAGELPAAADLHFFSVNHLEYIGFHLHDGADGGVHLKASVTGDVELVGTFIVDGYLRGIGIGAYDEVVLHGEGATIDFEGDAGIEVVVTHRAVGVYV